MVLGQLDIHGKKVSLDSCLPLDTKINSRHIKDLNVINKVIKLIENNIKNNYDLTVKKSFLNKGKNLKP